MLLFNRFLPFLSTILVIIAFEVWMIRPRWFWYMAVTMLIIVVGTVWSITGAKFFNRTFWNFLSTPFFFLSSAFVFFMFVDSLIFQQLFILGVAVIYLLILRNIFAFLYQSKTYQPYALENIYSYVNMTSLFLFFANFYGLILFLRWPVWLSIILIFLLTSFLFMRTLWSHKIDWQKGKLYILLIGILLAEAGYVLSLLPTSYLFNALILILIYYLLMNIIRDYLAHLINEKNLRKYLLITLSLTIIAFLTTRWY